jgi:hypothetical protein
MEQASSVGVESVRIDSFRRWSPAVWDREVGSRFPEVVDTLTVSDSVPLVISIDMIVKSKHRVDIRMYLKSEFLLNPS